MKLRNKKTGEIVELKLVQVNDKYMVDHEVDFLNGEKLTLKLLANSFDDVKEPLIKDEKIRKAVRAWAEAIGGRDKLLCIKIAGRLEVSDGSPHLIYVSFHVDESTLKSIDDRTYYTIAELCGEEEECES